jgi:enamine deaminase RidA (YjgF/YER057c/UK114 family)
MALKKIVPGTGFPKPKGVWSTAVEARPGRLIFISGLVSRNEAGDVVGEGDITAQTDQVCRNLQQAITNAGGTLEDLVRVDVYVRNIGEFEKIHAVRRRYFPKDPPASTMVEVSRMTDERFLIEINAIAVLP